MDYARRDRILEPYFVDKEYFGGVRRFKGVPYSVMYTLACEGFIDLGMAQNFSPTISTFMLIMKNNPEMVVDGYVVSPRRSDVRVSVDGISGKCNANDSKLLKYHYPDDYSYKNGVVRAWWD